uniref:Transket_pyr domain-containing protein n=1 Tax=Macrostomum lignano TaxID=282301 RepID=A0A1I8FMG7_9PLAT
ARGHNVARLDPLDITRGSLQGSAGSTAILNKDLSAIECVLQIYRASSCFINNHEQCEWLREKFETPGVMSITPDEKRAAAGPADRFYRFEEFLARKEWSAERAVRPGGRRGDDPGHEDRDWTCPRTWAWRASTSACPTAGRLNVLANVARKPLENCSASSTPSSKPWTRAPANVKYHLATRGRDRLACWLIRLTWSGGPGVSGQDLLGSSTEATRTARRSCPSCLHGDAAFLRPGRRVGDFPFCSDLPNYSTHGTVHIVGFTTDPRVARSSPYCTDVAREVIHVARVAASGAGQIRKDVVIDLVCYRRNGHNEMDEPMFTQRLMYKKIKGAQNEGTVTQAEYDEESQRYDKVCEDAFTNAKPRRDESSGYISDVGQAEQDRPGVLHRAAGLQTSSWLKRTLRGRAELLGSTSRPTGPWAKPSPFAACSRGLPCRCRPGRRQRGTFSHRHHVLHDQEKDLATYVPLNNIEQGQATYTVCNSSLSEYAVMGFELGYSLNDPNALIMWEAQFGDFNNTAQCIIDQFRPAEVGSPERPGAAAAARLRRHGPPSTAPPASSASCRCPTTTLITSPCCDEDFMMQQLPTDIKTGSCATSPHRPNYFHLMRRQVLLPFRKPLVLMTPKSLLRLPEARSSFAEMTGDSSFQRLIPDQGPPAKADPKESEEELNKYPFARVQWVQEEHKNMGSWFYVQPRVNNLIRSHCPDRTHRHVSYAGRPPSASAAAGNKQLHLMEIAQFLKDAMSPV